MRNILLFGCLLLAAGCGDSMHVTANPDHTAATSGTLGSAKAENQIPMETRDTAARRDTTGVPHN